MQKAGLFTINAWAIDGFTKVFWRDLPVQDLWQQVSVLLAVGIGVVRDCAPHRTALGVRVMATRNDRRSLMTGSMEEQELKDRLSLIESMISEGRRSTESWGWMFVFWGVAYYIAIAWATWGHSSLAWPVTMIVASLLAARAGLAQGAAGAPKQRWAALSALCGSGWAFPCFSC